MKFLILMAIPFFGLSQAKDCPKTLLGVGVAGGYSSVKSIVGEGYIAVKPTRSNFIFTPLSIKAHGANSPTIPVIFESRAGYKVKFVEPYLGLSYHMAGQDGKPCYDKYKGFKPAAGLIVHPFKKIIVSAGVSGNIYTVQLGVFDFEKVR